MMVDGIYLANFAIAVSGLVVSVLGLLLVVFLRRAIRESFGLLLVFFLLLVGYTASATACQLADMALMSQATLFCESLFSSLLMPTITLYLLRCVGASWRRNPLFALVVALWAVYFALLLVTQFTTFIYYYTPDNAYHRGPWYPLLLVPPALLMVVNIVGLYRYRDALTSRQRTAFLVYFAVPLACMLVQMFSYGLLLIVLGTSAGALFMVAFLLVDQLECDLRLQRDLAHQRASVMVLRMRPHFNAVASEDPIPFTAELEHARAYLAVEKAQLEDLLVVELDTPHTSFRLPPLSLQPIVENAVKHGVSPYEGALHLCVRTCLEDTCSVVTVEDDGPGFDPSVADDPGTTLANIRQRLQMMCGGTLEIAPREGGGTVVKMTIPLVHPGLAGRSSRPPR